MGNFRDLHISVTGSDGHQQAISPYFEADYFGGQHASTYTRLVKVSAGDDIAQFTGSLAAPRAWMLDFDSKTAIGTGFTGTVRLWDGGIAPISCFYSGSSVSDNSGVRQFSPIQMAVREVSGSNCDFYAIY